MPNQSGWHAGTVVGDMAQDHFVGFNLILLTTNLILSDYGEQFSSYLLATAAALVVGKAVLVANAMRSIRHYDRAPLIRAARQIG